MKVLDGTVSEIRLPQLLRFFCSSLYTISHLELQKQKLLLPHCSSSSGWVSVDAADQAACSGLGFTGEDSEARASSLVSCTHSHPATRRAPPPTALFQQLLLLQRQSFFLI
ncbi:hypothetical protein M422DRAFT_243830 [Sphaerobolus stellatus SS14]|nr:hypothetical protein M422DRAFT_243830 [Sphaerobolus stellatus SS14]